MDAEFVLRVCSEWERRREDYTHAGSCLLAAFDAEEWLARKNSTRDGILTSSAPLVFTHNGNQAPHVPARKCTRKFRLEHGCFWVLVREFDECVDVKGCKHTVCQVNSNTCIDWSLPQFANVGETEVFMYL